MSSTQSQPSATAPNGGWRRDSTHAANTHMGAANMKTVLLVYCCVWSYKQVGSTDVSVYIHIRTLYSRIRSHMQVM